MSGGCHECLRRGWLLGELSPLLDYHRADPPRLMALLELPDESLIKALAGRRRSELLRRWAEPGRASMQPEGRAETTCRHDRAWPARLAARAEEDEGGGRLGALWISGSAGRLKRLLAAPTVAILGTEEPSRYGAGIATSLSRSLAATNVTVLCGVRGRLAGAAHGGALEAGRGSVALAGDGLGRIRPAEGARLGGRVAGSGCVVSELSGAVSGRGWGNQATLRLIVALADLCVLIEAGQDQAATIGVAGAMELGRAVGAVPGPATSVLSAGPHGLIRRGATLVRDAGDILELLHGQRPMTPEDRRGPRLEPRLQRVLERVGAGEDTAEALGRTAGDPGDAISALGELEAAGLLRRVDGGRYVPSGPVSWDVTQE